jgi:hypothetical protein
MENHERMTEAGDSRRPSKTEDQFTKTIEEYTSAVPSSAYLVWLSERWRCLYFSR